MQAVSKRKRVVSSFFLFCALCPLYNFLWVALNLFKGKFLDNHHAHQTNLLEKRGHVVDRPNNSKKGC